MTGHACVIDDDDPRARARGETPRADRIMGLLVRAGIQGSWFKTVEECQENWAALSRVQLMICHAYPDRPERQPRLIRLLNGGARETPAILFSGAWTSNKRVDGELVRQLAGSRPLQITRGVGMSEIGDNLVPFFGLWQERHFDPQRIPWESLFAGDECLTRVLNPRISELEQLRLKLSHGLLKNGFRCKLLSGDSAFPPEERAEDIMCFWDESRRNRLDPGAWQLKKQNVEEAMKAWATQDIRTQLASFFAVALRYGFSLSDKGRRLRRELFESPGCAADIIDAFVDDFLGGQMGSGTPSLAQKLEEFVAAVDSLEEGFQSMAHYSESREFFGGVLGVGGSDAHGE